MDTMKLHFSEGEKFETEAGRFFNQNWGQLTHHIKVNNTGICMERTTDRYSSNLLNERENFFHKPLVNLNHFYEINEQMRLSSVLYWSGGSGGGTGTYGSVSRSPLLKEKDGMHLHLGHGIGILRLNRILTILILGL